MIPATLYKITYLPTNQIYYGSTWAKGKTIYDRLNEHLTHKGGKYISELINNGAKTTDFIIEPMVVGEVGYICDLESKLALGNLHPKGLNGNAGKNIIRTIEGQAKVSAAVSKAKLGKTKETSTGVARQAEKVKLQKGLNRTESQKAWDAKKADTNKQSGNMPPTLPVGSKKMNNGLVDTFVHPNKVESYLLSGWVLGSCKPPKKGYTIQNMKIREIVTCPYCNKIGNISQMKRWHYENCKSRKIN